MKKTLIFILLIYFTFANVYSQSKITASEHIVGKNYTNGKEVKALFYDFSSSFFSNIVDTKNNRLILMFRTLRTKQDKEVNEPLSDEHYLYKGHIMSYDLVSNEIKWTREIDYSLTKVIFHNDILLLGSKSTIRVDLETGLNLWETPQLLISSIPSNSIALGYKNLANNKKLLGIDLATGEKKWTRKIKNPLALDRVIQVDDTSLIVHSRGLHAFNVENGLGWDYNSFFGLSDYQKQFRSDLTAADYYSITGLRRNRYPISNFESNILSDSDDLYYISKYELVKLSENGLVQWKASLPSETGKVYNFQDKSYIYIIYSGEQTYKSGRATPEKPFISAYYKKNGTQKFYSDLYTKEDYMIDCELNKDSLKLVFPEKISWFSLTKGVIVKTIRFDKEKTGLFAKMINADNIYIQSADSILQNLCDVYPHGYFIRNLDNQVVVLDANHQYLNTINSDDLYFMIHEDTKIKFLYHNNELTVLSIKNEKIGKLDVFSDQIFFLNNHAYEIVKNKIIETDLDQFYK